MRRLKEEGTYFKVKLIYSYEISKLIIFSFQATIDNYR